MKETQIKYKYYSLIVLVLLAIVGCKGDGDNKKNVSVDGVSFDSLVVDTVASLVGQNPESKASVHMSVMYAKDNEQVNKSIMRSGIFYPEDVTLKAKGVKDAMLMFMRQFVEDYKRDYNDIYRYERNAPALKASYRLETRIAGTSDKTFSYEADVSVYAGGVHESKSVFILTMDKKTGNILTLQNVFVPGFERQLVEMIICKLCKQNEVENLDELSEKSFFAGVAPYASDDFILTDDDITFVYSADEIAPHSFGEQRVTLKIEEMSKILNKGFVND